MRYLSLVMVAVLGAMSAGCLSFGEAGSERDMGGGLDVAEVQTDPSNDPTELEPCATDDDCTPSDNLCNGPPLCIKGACFPGKGPSIFDGKQCTNDACDPETGVISHTPVSMDDGDPCTEDACTEGVGITHTPIKSEACGS